MCFFIPYQVLKAQLIKIPVIGLVLGYIKLELYIGKGGK